MARDAEMDRRLWLWAERLKVGDGSGYPVKSTLHPDWSPPSPGITPTMKVSPGKGRDCIGRLVAKLPDSLVATLVAKYVVRLSDGDAALALGCAPPTVAARVERAHRELHLLDARERAAP